MVKHRMILEENKWYSAYHFNSNRMLNVRYLGRTDQGMKFEDTEKRVYSNRDFYFWKTTE